MMNGILAFGAFLSVALAKRSAWAAEDLRPLAEAVLHEGRIRGKTIACAESCTGGLVQGALTAIPGSSEVLKGGVVSYVNEVKEKVLGVPRDILDGVGAVSRECALAMAEGVLRLCGADAAVSVTGVAGPGGGTDGTPVGCVWFGLASRGGGQKVQSTALRCQFTGDRDAIRDQAVRVALSELKRTLERL